MAESLPRDWIGAPLRSVFACALVSPLPGGIDALLARIDGTLSRETFARDLTAVMPKLLAYARSLTRDRDAAEDLVQDTLLKAWKARDQFALGTSLRAWTCTILRNVFLTQRRRARFDGDYDELVADIRLARPEAQSDVVELGLVRRAMAALNPDQRAALDLVSEEGLSYEEAARRLDISLGSFKSRVWRGRRMLQSIIDGDVQGIAAAPIPSHGPNPDRPRARAAGQPLWIG